MSNYHWYLKQSYNFDMKNKVSSVQWDPEDVNALHVLTLTGFYINWVKLLAIVILLLIIMLQLQSLIIVIINFYSKLVT